MTLCSASNLSAIFAAVGVSSTLFANFIETALILRSGLVLRSNDKTSVESTPPLRAIDASFELWDCKLLSISSQIEVSMEGILGGLSIGTKSSHCFLGKFGCIEVS